MGYNSFGAGCLINHLHFELFWTPESLPNLAIENAKSTALFKSNLEHISKEDENEINVVSFFYLFFNNYSFINSLTQIFSFLFPRLLTTLFYAGNWKSFMK